MIIDIFGLSPRLQKKSLHFTHTYVMEKLKDSVLGGHGPVRTRALPVTGLFLAEYLGQVFLQLRWQDWRICSSNFCIYPSEGSVSHDVSACRWSFSLLGLPTRSGSGQQDDLDEVVGLCKSQSTKAQVPLFRSTFCDLEPLRSCGFQLNTTT